MDNAGPELTNPPACIGCGHCIAICPRNAVSDNALPGDDVIPSQPGPVSPDCLLTMMKGRRSCRHYTQAAVSPEEIKLLLSAARACPTAKNLQGTRYIAVTEHISPLLDLAISALGNLGRLQRETATDPDELRRAENFVRWAEQRKKDKNFDPLFFHAPLLLLFVSDRTDARDAAATAAYVELMAASLGLGCLYSGYFTACAAGSSEIRTFLKLTEQEQVARCLVLGHPDVKFIRSAPRKPVDLTRI